MKKFFFKVSIVFSLLIFIGSFTQVFAGLADFTKLLKGMAARNAGCITYKDADEIYLPGNTFEVAGKVAYWDSQLTKIFTNLSTSSWYYIYLDYSEIKSDTEITASEIIESTTVPTYDHEKKGWYNGNDRCIGAVLTDGNSNILKFSWNSTSNLYSWDAPITELTNGTATTFTDIDFSSSVPNFGEVYVECRVRCYGQFTTSSFPEIKVRKNGTLDEFELALEMGGVNGRADFYTQFFIETDSSQLIEYMRDYPTYNLQVVWIKVRAFFLQV